MDSPIVPIWLARASRPLPAASGARIGPVGGAADALGAALRP